MCACVSAVYAASNPAVTESYDFVAMLGQATVPALYQLASGFLPALDALGIKDVLSLLQYIVYSRGNLLEPIQYLAEAAQTQLQVQWARGCCLAVLGAGGRSAPPPQPTLPCLPMPLRQ